MEPSNLLNSFQCISRNMVEIINNGVNVHIRTLIELKDTLTFILLVFQNNTGYNSTSSSSSMIKNFIEVMDISIIQRIIPELKDNETLILLFQIIRYYVGLLNTSKATLASDVIELLKAQNSNIIQTQGELTFGNILDISIDPSFSIEVRLEASKLLWESLKSNHYFFEILITSGQIYKLIDCMNVLIERNHLPRDYILRCFCGCVYSICKGVVILPGAFKDSQRLVTNLILIFKHNGEPLTRLLAGFSLTYIICESIEFKEIPEVRKLIGYIMQHDIYKLYQETIDSGYVGDNNGNTIHSFLLDGNLYDDETNMASNQRKDQSEENDNDNSKYSASFISCRLTLLSVICKNNKKNTKILVENDCFELIRALISLNTNNIIDYNGHRENELRVGNKKIKIDLFQTNSLANQDVKLLEYKLVGFNLLSIILPLQKVHFQPDDYEFSSKQTSFIEEELFPTTIQLVFQEANPEHGGRENDDDFSVNHSSDFDKHLIVASMLNFLNLLTISKNNLFYFVEITEKDPSPIIKKFMNFTFRLGSFEFGANNLFYFLLYVTNVLRFYNKIEDEELNETLEYFKILLVKSGMIKFALKILLYFMTPPTFQKQWTVWCRTQAMDLLVSLTYNSKYAVLKLLSENDIMTIWYIMKRKSDDLKILLGCVSIIKNVYWNKNINKGTKDKEYRHPTLMELMNADDKAFLDCVITNTSTSYVDN